MTKLIAIDPGGTTGLCYVEDGRVIARSQVGPKSANTPRAYDDHSVLYDIFCKFLPDCIIYERFDYRPNQKIANIIASEYIGVIKLYSQHTDTPTYGQSSSVGKVTSKAAFWKADKIKRIGLWLPTRPHAMDATGHMLYYLTFNLKDTYYLNQLKTLGDFE